MPRILYRLVALCLAFAWVPATMCCSLEAAGWDVLCSNVDCQKDSGQSAADGCDAVDAGLYQSSSPSVKIALTVATLCACATRLFAFERDFESRKAVCVAETTRTRDWIPVWQFERRAAAPAHAPDSLIA